MAFWPVNSFNIRYLCKVSVRRCFYANHELANKGGPSAHGKGELTCCDCLVVVYKKPLLMLSSIINVFQATTNTLSLMHLIQFFLLICTNALAQSQNLASGRICSTISGPSANQKCVLPFKFDGKIYNKCPIDPEDSTKNWCSTKVDVNGVHVPKIGAYGHCGPNCPKVRRPKQNVQSRRLTGKKCIKNHLCQNNRLIF